MSRRLGARRYKRRLLLAARPGMRQGARFPQARKVGGQRYDAMRWGLTRVERQRGRGARFLVAWEDDLRASGERDGFLSMAWSGLRRGH